MPKKRQTWDLDDWFDPWDEDGGVPDASGYISPDAASDELGHYIIYLKRAQYLSSKQACCLAWWACKAGASGTVARLAKDPTSTGFSRHFDNVALSKETADTFYEAEIPCHVREEASHSLDWAPINLPLDAIEKELQNNADMIQKLNDMVADCHLPKRYTSHPVVQQAPAGVHCIPCSLYVDGVPFSRVDGAIAI